MNQPTSAPEAPAVQARNDGIPGFKGTGIVPGNAGSPFFLSRQASSRMDQALLNAAASNAQGILYFPFLIFFLFPAQFSWGGHVHCFAAVDGRTFFL